MQGTLKLLALGGYHTNGGQLIEVNSNGENGTCSVLPEIPEFMSGSVAAITRQGDEILICGGYETRKCYSFRPTNGEWVQKGSLDYQRHGAALVDLGSNGYLVTGGEDEDQDPTQLNSSIYFKGFKDKYTGHL